MNPIVQAMSGGAVPADLKVTREVIDRVLNAPDKSASDLVSLYLTLVTGDAETLALADAAVVVACDRIIAALNGMADAGDEEALLGVLGLLNLMAEETPPPARTVFAAMLEVLMLKPLILDAAQERVDYITAGIGVAVIKSFMDSLLHGDDDDEDDADDAADDAADAEAHMAELAALMAEQANGPSWQVRRD